MVHWRAHHGYGVAVCHFCCPQVWRKTRRSTSKTLNHEKIVIFLFPLKKVLCELLLAFIFGPKDLVGVSPWHYGSLNGWQRARKAQGGVLVSFPYHGASLLGHPLLGHPSWVTSPGASLLGHPSRAPLLGAHGRQSLPSGYCTFLGISNVSEKRCSFKCRQESNEFVAYSALPTCLPPRKVIFNDLVFFICAKCLSRSLTGLTPLDSTHDPLTWAVTITLVSEWGNVTQKG